MRFVILESQDLISDSLKVSLKRARVESDIIQGEAALLSLGATELNLYGAILIGTCQDQPNIVRELRNNRVTAPVIVLSDMRNAELALDAFAAGADDFVVKPFNALVLQARVHAIARRMSGTTSASFEVGGLTIYQDGRDPEVNGRRIKLSHREHAIFNHLARHMGRVVAKESVYTAVYGTIDSEPFDKVIDVYICKLRKKLAEATGGKQYIETVFCRGYKMDSPENTVVQRLSSGSRSAA